MSRRRFRLDHDRDVSEFLARSSADPDKLIIVYWITGGRMCTCCGCDPAVFDDEYHDCGGECDRPAIRIAEMFLGGNARRNR